MVSLLLRFSSTLLQINVDNVRLRKGTDRVLRQPTRELSRDEINSENFKHLVDKMVHIMREFHGQGLAAPQVGSNLQLVVVEFSQQDYNNAIKYYGSREVEKRDMRIFPLTVLVNPKMKVTDFGTTIFEEGCLSLDRTIGKVERYKKVEVEAIDQHGEAVKFTATGWMARIIQHEVHHLKGILITDCFVKISKSWLRR